LSALATGGKVTSLLGSLGDDTAAAVPSYTGYAAPLSLVRSSIDVKHGVAAQRGGAVTLEFDVLSELPVPLAVYSNFIKHVRARKMKTHERFDGMT
jgi:hypothetical protein